MSNYSYSRLDLYDGCPRAYKLRYIDKRPELPSEALERGTVVHEAVAAYARHCLKAGVQTDLDFIRSFPGTDEVREILETFASTHLFEPGDYVIEKMWEIPLGAHTWWGVIDLLKDEGPTVRITDVKTDHRIRSQSEIDHDRQLKDYAWMASRKYPEAQEFLCSIDFARHGVTRSVTYNREDMQAIEDQIILGMELIEQDSEFRARPGTRCSWCSWTADCPSIASGDLEVITSPCDAEVMAEELVALKARVKVVEDQLKPWCTREGSIDVNGMAVGYQTVHSAGYRVEALMELLERHGYEPLNYLRPDAAAIKKIPKKDKELADDLASIAEDKSSSRFDVRKGEA